MVKINTVADSPLSRNATAACKYNASFASNSKRRLFSLMHKQHKVYCCCYTVDAYSLGIEIKQHKLRGHQIKLIKHMHY
jgi:hypothetical protein